MEQYTKEETILLVELYTELYKEEGNTCLESIAIGLDKTERSVRSKLVTEKIYISNKKKSIRKESTKKELVAELVSLTKNDKLWGLLPVSKSAIKELKSLIVSK